MGGKCNSREFRIYPLITQDKIASASSGADMEPTE